MRKKRQHPDPVRTEHQYLWLGTRRNGLCRFDTKSNSVSTFTTYNGLPSNSIYAVLEDQRGNLGLSTNNGLSCFDPQSKTFENFFESDGLQSREFNGGAFYKSRSVEMFFGGISGLNSFFPDRIKRNSYAPSVVSTSLTIFPHGIRINGENLEKEGLGGKSSEGLIWFLNGSTNRGILMNFFTGTEEGLVPGGRLLDLRPVPFSKFQIMVPIITKT